MAISSPSEDTATASVTPAVWSTKLFSSQLKLRASSRKAASSPVLLVVVRGELDGGSARPRATPEWKLERNEYTPRSRRGHRRGVGLGARSATARPGAGRRDAAGDPGRDASGRWAPGPRRLSASRAVERPRRTSTGRCGRPRALRTPVRRQVLGAGAADGAGVRSAPRRRLLATELATRGRLPVASPRAATRWHRGPRRSRRRPLHGPARGWPLLVPAQARVRRSSSPSTEAGRIDAGSDAAGGMSASSTRCRCGSARWPAT